MNLRERVMEAVAAVEVTVPKCRCGAQSFIPQGYEVCDLADATKVLIGETWFEKAGIIIQRAGSPHYFTEEALEPLGVLAIRPIPEPEPMKGEADVHSFDVTHGFVSVPVDLIGKRVRWEVIE